MRCWRLALVTTLGCLLIAGPASAVSDDPGLSEPLDRRGEVAVLVLAQDARFGGLLDYERQQMKMQSQFSFDPVLGSGYYRMLPTAATQWTFEGAEDWVVFRHPRNWIVEVVLVRDCEELAGGDVGPLADPCGWRHAWYYRVQPDDLVTLLFEEGDPDPMPAG